MTILVNSSTQNSDKNRWSTTWRCFEHAKLLTGYSFMLDVAAELPTAKCANFISPEENAFSVDWIQRMQSIEARLNKNAIKPSIRPVAAWCNPPFDNKFEFIEEVCRYSKLGLPTTMLIPYERGTIWWRQYIKNKARRVYVPDGRYNFYEVDGKTQKGGVNFNSCFVEFSPAYFEHTEYIEFSRSSLDEKLDKRALSPLFRHKVRDLIRQAGVTSENVTQEQLASLMCHLRKSVKQSELRMHNFKPSKQLFCKTDEKTNQEAVTFHDGGFISFGDWLCDKGVQPILQGVQNWLLADYGDRIKVVT